MCRACADWRPWPEWDWQCKAWGREKELVIVTQPEPEMVPSSESHMHDTDTAPYGMPVLLPGARPEMPVREEDLPTLEVPELQLKLVLD